MLSRPMLVLFSFLLSLGVHAAQFPAPIQTDARVVAFADVHGAFDDWTAMLRELQVIDNKNDWSGGNTHLVSLGDLIDRGPGSRQVVELLMKLEQQAPAAGGAVHVALGNHEVMVMTGDLRYVSHAEYAAFAADETALERDALWQSYRQNNPGGEELAVREVFEQEYPPGFVGLRKAYGPDGALGRWLRQRPFVLQVNDKIYLHGGISSKMAELTVTEINQRSRTALDTYLQYATRLEDSGILPGYVGFFDRSRFLNARAEEALAVAPKKRPAWFDDFLALHEAQKLPLFGEDSPIWYRGNSRCHPYAESYNTERFLKRNKARQIVVGHTPSRGQVISRMEGQLIRLDSGMLQAVYKGKATALVTVGGESYVHTLGESAPGQPVVLPRSLSQRLSQMNDADLEHFLRTATIESTEFIGTGVTKPKRVVLVEGERVRNAVFKYADTNPGMEKRRSYSSRRNNDSDRFVYDVAAYKLDRMLGWEMVPTAVLREVDGDKGMLQDWVENSINERDRLEQKVDFSSFCKQMEQYRLRFVFDVLIYNEDRNLTNILWTKNAYMMMFIDHSLAFRSYDRRPKQYRKVSLLVSDLLRDKLQSLNAANLGDQLGAYLHPRQIEAILKRRDRILKEAKGTDLP